MNIWLLDFQNSKPLCSLVPCENEARGGFFFKKLLMWRPGATLVSEGSHDVTGAMLICVALCCHLAHDIVLAWAVVDGHVWVSGSAVAGICVYICGLCYDRGHRNNVWLNQRVILSLPQPSLTLGKLTLSFTGHCSRRASPDTHGRAAPLPLAPVSWLGRRRGAGSAPHLRGWCVELWCMMWNSQRVNKKLWY